MGSSIQLGFTQCFLHLQGQVADDEMCRTFNCGVGLVMITSGDNANDVCLQTGARIIGTVQAQTRGKIIWCFCLSACTPLSTEQIISPRICQCSLQLSLISHTNQPSTPR